jgi:hypothetical protein
MLTALATLTRLLLTALWNLTTLLACGCILPADVLDVGDES